LLDAPDIILSPIPLGDFLLSDGDTAPANPHDRDIIHIILVEFNLKAGVMSLGPLVQSPALHDLGGLDELEILTRYIPAEQLELPTLLGALPNFGGGTREGGDTLGVGEGLVELGSGGPEFFGVCDGCCIDQSASLRVRSGGCGCGCCRRGGWGKLGFGETA